MCSSPAAYPGITPLKFGTLKPRKMLSMSHILTGHTMSTHNNSLNNLCRGVGERVLFTNAGLSKPIQPRKGHFVLKLNHYREQLRKIIGWQSPVTYDEFVDYYKGPRKLTYRRAVDGLALKPVHPRDSILKTFVKAEKNNLTLKADYVPRVIQPRSPRYNVEVGIYLRPLEKRLYAAINELFGSPTMLSSYNAYRQAEIIKNKWDEYSSPVCVGLDASRFDQHVSRQALKFEHGLYNSIYNSGPFKELLSWQLSNYGFATAADGMFTYKRNGCRMSGDMNTSMGNKLLMCLMGKSYLDSLNFKCSFVNNGDDCLLILDKKNLHGLDGLAKYFTDFGFNLVCEKPVYEFEQIEFCQTKPILCNGIWRMVRNVRTCLSKDLTCVNLGHNIDEYRAWMYDVGGCGKSIAGDVPVLGVFYNMMQRIGKEGHYNNKDKDEYLWYRNLTKNCTLKHTSPDAHGRYSFWLSTGISPDEQLILEDYIQAADWGGNKRQLITAISTLFK